MLNINIFALSQPIMITGVSGASLGSMTMKSEIIEGNVYIPTTGAGAQPPEVLDLMAEDHTQNLISTIDWCDARILEIMASSNGVEKSSGISTMETVSGVQSIMQDFESGLELRREWADRVNDRLRLSLSVKAGSGIAALGADKGEEKPAEGEDDAAERLPLRSFAMPQDGGRGAEDRAHGAHHEQDIVSRRFHRRDRLGRIRDSDSMSCCDCIEVDTPQSIIDEGSTDKHYQPETDIFEEIFDTASGTFTNGAAMQSILWSRYRYEGLGSCDSARWVQVMADRLDMIGPRWDDIISKSLDVDMTDLAELSYQRQVDRTAIPETNGSIRTVSHSGIDGTTVTHETLPQSPIDGVNYADDRSKTERSNGQTDTDTYKPNERDAETYHEYRDIEAATFSRLISEYPEIPERFAAEFADLFLGRWRCRHTLRPASIASRAPSPPGSTP